MKQGTRKTVFQNKRQTEVSSLENIISWWQTQAKAVFAGGTSLILTNLRTDFFFACLKIDYLVFHNCATARTAFSFIFCFSSSFGRSQNGVFNHSLQYRMQIPLESWRLLSLKSSVEFVLSYLEVSHRVACSFMVKIFKSNSQIHFNCLIWENLKIILGDSLTCFTVLPYNLRKIRSLFGLLFHTLSCLFGLRGRVSGSLSS